MVGFRATAMGSKAIAVLAATVMLAAAGCRAASPPESSAPPPAAADPKTEALLQGFAAAVAARDYASAYGAVAVERRSSLSLAEFQEAISHYRDGLPDVLKTSVRIDPYDRESAAIVPDEYRDRIVSEGVVYFDPEDEDLEGFSVHVWLLSESGEPRLATFFVGD